MPILINASTLEPEPDIEATSDDGTAYAKLDRPWSGVFLSFDLSALDPVPKSMLVMRVNPDGTSVRVRGSDPGLVMSGEGVAYDHEAPVGFTSSWYAIPLDSLGNQGEHQASVTMPVPAPIGGKLDPGLWIKNLERPELSTHVMINDWPEETWELQLDLATPWGSSSSIGGVGAVSRLPLAIKTLTLTELELTRFTKLIEFGGVMLFQPSPKFFKKSFYGLIQTASVANATAKMSQVARISSWGAVPVKRPPTKNQRMIVPGHSYGDRLDSLPTYFSVPPRTYKQALGF